MSGLRSALHLRLSGVRKLTVSEFGVLEYSCTTCTNIEDTPLLSNDGATKFTTTSCLESGSRVTRSVCPQFDMSLPQTIFLPIHIPSNQQFFRRGSAFSTREYTAASLLDATLDDGL